MHRTSFFGSSNVPIAAFSDARMRGGAPLVHSLKLAGFSTADRTEAWAQSEEAAAGSVGGGAVVEDEILADIVITCHDVGHGQESFERCTGGEL